MCRRVSFEHADELMQGLITVSPTKIDTPLKACRNIKVNAGFLGLQRDKAMHGSIS